MIEDCWPAQSAGRIHVGSVSAKYSTKSLSILLSFVVVACPPACSRRGAAKFTSPPKEEKEVPRDACSLLNGEDLKQLLGEIPAKIDRSETTGSGFLISQCFFNLPTFSNSIAVSITRRAPGPNGRDPKQYWEDKIEKHEGDKGEPEDEEEHKRPPDPIAGLGDGAMWAGTSVGGALYVLKGNSMVRVSMGTTSEPAKRREKAIALVRLLLQRL